METVLVTGAAGFIGSNLVEALLKKGNKVVGVDNFDDGLYEASFKEKNIKSVLSDKNFILYRVDIREKEALKDIFEKEKPQYIAHLAARANVRNAAKDPYPYVSINIEGTINILELSRDFNVKNLVIASSGSVYGDDPNMPWSEDHLTDKPVSPYGATKRACELLAYTYHRNHNLNITCLRYFNAYGENNRPDLVPYIWGKAILSDEEIEISGDGSRKRDYTYVGDVVDATVLALEKPLGFEIINIGNSSPVSLKELVSIFEKVSGKKANVKSRPSNSVSMESTYADISKAKKLLGWEPKMKIEKGIGRLLTWLSHR
ncbi:MAG: SDR family NAD(P)-dependent oxidoreductase [Candidatus Zambryskibacteria bacterium]|nr:SDR family NAD(P)-dependent oxidoreductase [Candidatus Zambryskibacteria bacterium]